MTQKNLILGIDPRGAVAGAAVFKKAANSTAAAAKRAALGVTSMVGAMAGIAGVGAAIRTIGGFENRMTALKVVAKATKEEFQAMSKVARELGAATKFSGEEAAEGMLALSRAGFSANETMAAIADTLDLATAAEIGLAEASGFVSNTIRQFGLDASEAGDVADAFTVAANRSNTTVSDLAQAMVYAGTVAATLGLTVAETAATIGVLGDRGIQSSMAGTNLRGVLLALTDPTDKVRSGLEQLGLTYDEVDPATNKYVDVMERLGKGFKDLENPLEAAGIANSLFGRRNAAAAVTISTSTTKLKELRDEINRSEKRTPSLLGRWKARSSADSRL